ncbi:MAG TPA: thymidylate synthase [Candidatus Deferrimicrobium sp.]|nr:thymidylate synthase [Candidatus Deferrimicrobium sp.]
MIPHLPILFVEAETCGEAWEKAVEAVWYKGIEIEQHYSDELSKEASVLVNVMNPLQEPRFSRKDFVSVSMFVTGPDKKKPYREKQYVRDLIDGDMDHRVLEGVESYTYHERLFSWGLVQPKHAELLKQKKRPTIKIFDGITEKEFKADEGINQIEMLIEKAKEEPISRKLQVTTWAPYKDLIISGAPCLQRLWIRIIENKYMVLETTWRSRDLYKAVGANILGFTEFGRWLSSSLNLEFIQYVDFSNSLHIYKSDYDQVARHFEIIQKREKSS